MSLSEEPAAAHSFRESDLRHLVSKAGGRLRRNLSRILGNQADAEDIAQEAYRIMWEARVRLDYRNPEAVLFTTARRLAVQELQKRARDLQRAGIFIDDETVADTPEQLLSAKQECELYQTLMASLPERQRKAYDLYLEGWTQLRIAEVLGVSDRSVRTYIEKVLFQFAQARNAGR